MTYPVKYTLLGFRINSLIDKGETLSLKETHKHIREKTLFAWLDKKYGKVLDFGSYPDSIEIEEFFEGLSVAVDEGRKMGIYKNGLCLLVAYCFEALQQKYL
ncbi:hypothetical protein [Emticicia sp. 17c]|uniref:hypothetical protein n=1 Tax=Emticicia sp. 17c TaxID=3127704 RepID=UPI00301DA207